MSKALEKPAWRVIVQPGRLVAADAYTEEQLDIYPHGTVLECRMAREKTTWRKAKERRFWAILGKAIKTCNTPWKNTEEASDALKLQLGVVDPGATIAGDVISYPAKTGSLDDTEYAIFYEGAMALLTKVTGVDPETLGREANAGPDPGARATDWKPDETEQEERVVAEDVTVNTSNFTVPDCSSPGDEPYQADEAIRPPNKKHAVDTAEETAAVGFPPPAAGGSGNAAAPPPPITGPTGKSATAATESGRTPTDCVRKLIALARDPDISADEKLAELESQRPLWKEALAPDQARFVDSVVETAKRVAKGELQGGSASAYLFQMAKPTK